MYMEPHDQEFNSFSALVPAAAATPPTVIPRLEEFRDHQQPCSSRNVRRTEQGRCRDYYSEEHETANTPILLSLGRGGFCVDINLGDIGNNNATETIQHRPAVASISRDEKNPLLLRKTVPSKVKNQVSYKCDKCDREFPSPQALGGHKTSHRPKPTTAIPDLNTTSRVFECSICHNVYDSGPALGGHKRKHYNLEKASTSSQGSCGPPSVIILHNGGSANHTATSGRGIDLNLPPELNDD